MKHGDQAVFICVATGWFPAPQVSWEINDTMADSVHYNTTVDANGTLFNSNSTLTISATDSAQVQCLAEVSAMSTPQTSSVFLIVGKNVILSYKVFNTKANNYSFLSFCLKTRLGGSLAFVLINSTTIYTIYGIFKIAK